jgi:hypothetical protein
MVVEVVEGTGGAVVVVVIGGVGAWVVAVSGAAVFDAGGADVAVVAGAEPVVVVTDPVLPVFPPSVGVVEESSVCCARRTVCEGGSDGAELEATTPPTMPPTKPAPTSAAIAKLRRFLTIRSCDRAVAPA